MYKHIQANFQPHIDPHQQYQLSTAGVIHCRVEIVTKSLQAAVAVVILKYFNSHLFGIQVMSQTHFLADEIDDPRPFRNQIPSLNRSPGPLRGYRLGA